MEAVAVAHLFMGAVSESKDMCVGGTNYKSVGNDSGLVLVAGVLL